MGRFDPTKPLDDPTVWFPPVEFWVSTDSQRNGKAGSADDSTPAFALDSSDYAALNRYVWTAKLLPTNREEYKNIIGISTDDELPDNVWDAADKVIDSYSVMQKEASDFLSGTWEDLVSAANKIYFYAQNAGGDPNNDDESTDSSYYRSMLNWVKDWWDENNKTNPDEKRLAELEESIKEATADQMKTADTLKATSDSLRVVLGTFHDACKAHQVDIDAKAKAVTDLITEENGIIDTLMKDIKQIVGQLGDLQADIEKDRKKIRETAYYVWIPFAGTIAGITVDIMTEKQISALRDQMEKLQDKIDQDNAKIQDATRLSGDMGSMADHMTELVDCIKPAITTSEKIQGAWSSISEDLGNLHDLFDGEKDRIPPAMMVQNDLNRIVVAWNGLKDDVDIFRKNAYMSTEPPRDTVKNMLDKLNNQLSQRA